MPFAFALFELIVTFWVLEALKSAMVAFVGAAPPDQFVPVPQLHGHGPAAIQVIVDAEEASDTNPKNNRKKINKNFLI